MFSILLTTCGYVTGDTYTVIDYFISEYQTNIHHRPQCAIILNEMLTFYVNSTAGWFVSHQYYDFGSTLKFVYRCHVMNIWCQLFQLESWGVHSMLEITSKIKVAWMHMYRWYRKFIHLFVEVCSKEILDSCTSVLELYSDGYRQLLESSTDDMSIRQRNESTQLQCVILEGFVVIHQVCCFLYYTMYRSNERAAFTMF